MASTAVESVVAATGFAAQEALCLATGHSPEMFTLEVLIDTHQALNFFKGIIDIRLRVGKLTTDNERETYQLPYYSPAAGTLASKVNFNLGAL